MNPSFLKSGSNKSSPPSISSYILVFQFGHLLQLAHSFLIAAPTPKPTAESDEDRPWLAFFLERERRATGPPPKRKPTLKVFHWDKDHGTGKWTRTPVIRRLNHETLGDYGKKQKHYDERTNEWDVATEMGEKDAEELQADFWEEGDDEPILPIGIRPASPPKVGALAGSSSVYGAEGAWGEDYHPDVHSPGDILRLLYGFVAPSASAHLVLPPATDQQIKDFALGVGFESTDVTKEYAQTPVGKAGVHFFWALSQFPCAPPPNILFDLASGNPRSLKYCRRLKFLRRLKERTFIFDFQGEATVEWKICIEDVTLALMILRMDEDLSDYDIARTLLNQGTAFRTVLHRSHLRVGTSQAKSIPRLRLSDYLFCKTDYDSYCHERDDILTNHRVARQALKRGGILWRLAVESATFLDVLTGPTSIATLQHWCTSLIADPTNIWIDDALDESEAEIISGVYHVYTGQGKQMATKSWWPPMDLWDTLSPAPSDAPSSPPPPFLSVPEFPRVETVSVGSTSLRGSETGSAALPGIESPQQFFVGRENSSLLDLFADYQLQDGKDIVKGIPTPPLPKVTRKPRFKQELYEGTEGVWSTLCWLIGESRILFCREILNASSLYMSPGNLTTMVFEKCISRPLFQELYKQHSRSELANRLSGGPNLNMEWDFGITNIAHCPYIRQLFRWTHTYLTEYIEWFITGVRHDTSLIATQSPTMGIKLLPNELSGGSSHIEAPDTRSAQAANLYCLIHPGHLKSVDDPNYPKRETIRRSMFTYLTSESNEKVANSVVGHLGRTNVALVVKELVDNQTSVSLPPGIVPLAGLFLESEILTVSNASGLHNGERVALLQNYQAFADQEDVHFRIINDLWKEITTPGPRTPEYFTEALKFVSRLGKAHNLDSSFRIDMNSRAEEEDRLRRQYGIWDGVEDLGPADRGAKSPGASRV
ncbi:hypothetical protein HYPSUDRAFT_207584 [Hypholoma sublateritium FD-334 SS-4]|uniref:Uncharacterized protein n=1 Tax=Hypholoma sublateritium (strain FD-334 SS-4) TaxID=945553 RepID=A0A0D2NGK1_HYPSF|nr:hypothetical protein HYPSUDRAFT_207584 [Hypholoma sublateritium FD-334 SS-4]